MASNFKSRNMKAAGVDDMVLLPKIEVSSIVENLDKRLKADIIYSYIGPVLVAVNPFKALPYFTDKEIEIYQGSAAYENPPHIYALCDNMFRNMVTDFDNQCVIISGESGAGKTVSAKFVMNYVTKVSGGGGNVQRVKDIILESNPLLEAFGNAKTVRNDNSSRFGKYVEMLFDRGGSPIGGKISNFLLEKSRVVNQNKNERNFHIFYQIISGLDSSTKQKLSISAPEKFNYINQSGCTTVDGVDDAKEYRDVRKAMDTIELSSSQQESIIQLVGGILHLGNINFTEERNQAKPTDQTSFDIPARLLGISASELHKKIVSREIESKWGKTSEIIHMEHNLEQANFTRDALAKGIYTRIFTFLVEAVNQAINITDYAVSIGILDIYGFEIFNKNGFEQFCINYVNEKLQQIFIELTLKVEQEEYVSEGIKWTPVKYFNNKIVCDLIECKRNPVGIMGILDDVCATMHAKSEGADSKLIEDLNRSIAVPEHFQISGAGFIIHHYAGRVIYDGDGFCERNRDVFFVDLIELLKNSSNDFLVSLFPEDPAVERNKGRPTTSSQKIKTQANILVEKLMKCTPHYIRCIKPNETKKPYDFDEQRVKHQVEYQGLKENIRIKRAGFAFRREFDKFLSRFAVLTEETFPNWKGSVKDGINHICRSVNMEEGEWQLGNTKVFIKKPESLFLLEEIRERKFDGYAVKIQKYWRSHHGNIGFDKNRENALNIVHGKKQRYAGSIRRKFFGDYIGVDERPTLRTFTERKEKILFSDVVKFYNAKLKPGNIDFMVTAKNIYMIGREKVKKGPNKGNIIEVLDRKVPISKLKDIVFSPLQDDFVLLNFNQEPSILFTTPFKTELANILATQFKKDSGGTSLPVSFEAKYKYLCKKGKKSTNLTVEFKESETHNGMMKTKSSGSKMLVQVKAGQPPTSKPQNVSQSFGKSANTGTTTKNVTASNNKSGKTVNDSANPNRPPPKKAPPPTPSSKKYPTAKVLWSYEANSPNELTLEENDIIEILDQDKSGWWRGRLNGVEGIFPGNYVELL